MSDTQEIVQRLEREMADRAAAVEKVDAFKNQLAQAIKAFMAVNDAVAASTTATASLTPKSQPSSTSIFVPSIGCAVSASTVVSVRNIRSERFKSPHGHGVK